MAKQKNTSEKDNGLRSFVSAIPGMPSFEDMMETAQNTGIPKKQSTLGIAEQESEFNEEDNSDFAEDATIVSDEEVEEANTETNSTVTPPPATQSQESKQKGRKEPALEQLDYTATFLEAPVSRVRKGKTIVLPDDIHNAILIAITGAPNKLPISDFIANVLRHHFEQYGPQIRRLISEKERKSKNNGLF